MMAKWTISCDKFMPKLGQQCGKSKPYKIVSFARFVRAKDKVASLLIQVSDISFEEFII
jgi:hypothetical protein